MWVRTDRGIFINLDNVRTITAAGCEIIAWCTDRTDYVVATFVAHKQAEAAMDKLEKWIGTGGQSASDLSQQPDTLVSPARSKVFSFRTLSEDDEF